MKKGFPKDLIRPTDRVLSLFSAAFLGKNDVQHIHSAGVTDCLMVDLDCRNLQEMCLRYHYNCHCWDAFTFIDVAVSDGNKWDVVVCDQWTGEQDEKINIEYLPKLQKIARRVLIVGCGIPYLDLPGSDYYYRSDHNAGTYWRVIC